MLQNKVSSAEIARQFNVTRATVSKLKKNQTWRHLAREFEIPTGKFDTKLIKEDIPLIRDYILKGSTNLEIAQIFKVHPGTISQIRIGKTWKNY